MNLLPIAIITLLFEGGLGVLMWWADNKQHPVAWYVFIMTLYTLAAYLFTFLVIWMITP